MNAATYAIHAIRNDLAPILFLAELAHAGDQGAAKLALSELLVRSPAIFKDLDLLTSLLQKQTP